MATPENTIDFTVKKDDGNLEILRLDKEGFHYKGETIKDAGKAHALFTEYMEKINMTIPTLNQPEREIK